MDDLHLTSPSNSAALGPFESAPAIRQHRGVVRLQRAADGLWRVIAPPGTVIGHLEHVAHPLGMRFRALRYHPASARFRGLGEFWSPDDAIDCLRHAA